MTQQDMATRVGVDPGWLDQFATGWVDAWNSHDPERVLALMTADVVYDDPAWPATMRGHAEVRPFLGHVFQAFPDLRFEVREGPYLRHGGLKAAFWWTGSGTHTGLLEPPGLEPTGRSIAFDGVDFLEYRDGKVAQLRIVFDMAGVSRQLGVLPPMGSKPERAIAKLVNLRTKVQNRR
jgi:steroid delta-isomerase-like uncharacterized protein